MPLLSLLLSKSVVLLFGSLFIDDTIYETYATFLQRILGYPVNILPQQESAGWAERASGLPAFPAPGSCAMLDGTAVLKLS